MGYPNTIWSKEVQQIPERYDRDCDQFFSYCRSLRKSLGLSAILRPEIAILLELYDAELQGERLGISSLGLRFDIPLTTVLRHVTEMEKQGWVERGSHLQDKRVTLVRISSAMFGKLNHAFERGVLVGTP